MRLLLVTLVALCLANPAWAELQVYSHIGSWDVFSGTGTHGRQTCGIGTTNPSTGRAFSLRFALGSDDVTFVADKPSWNIPEGTQVPVVMQVGLNRPWTVQATGHGTRLQWTMDRATVEAFDAQFRRANTMTVTFPDGSEQPWVISLSGSTAASNAMGRCVTTMTRNAATAAPAPAPATPQQPTQPFAPSNATPASPDQSMPPAQPAQSDQPGQPTQPTQAAPTPLAPTH